MRYYSGNVAIPLLSALISVVIMLAFFEYASTIYAKLAASLFFSVLIPAAFLLARSQIRRDRIHAADVFRRIFDGSLSSSVYFEFFDRKYRPGIEAPNAAALDVRSGGKYRFPRISAWLLSGASFPFIIFTTAGVFVLLTPAGELTKLLSGALGISPSGTDASVSKDYENALAIASLAFVSAYLYSLRLLFKSLIAYESFAIAFLRAFAHMLFAVMLAVMIWRIAPDTRPLVNAVAEVQNSIVGGNKVTVRPAPEAAPGAPQTPARPEEMPKLWLMLALVIGFLPGYSFSWLLQEARMALSRRYRLAAKHAPMAPLTVIDGIDFAKAYRLGRQILRACRIWPRQIRSCCTSRHPIACSSSWIGSPRLSSAPRPARNASFSSRRSTYVRFSIWSEPSSTRPLRLGSSKLQERSCSPAMAARRTYSGI